jgi:AcrR family transcriptional regulator
MSAPAADTRTRILEAATDVIVEQGYASARTAGIARAAGVSTALLHYHFDTKERLVEEVLRHSYETTTVLDLDAMRAAGRSAPVRLAAYLDRCLPSTPELERATLLWSELDLVALRHPELAAVRLDLADRDRRKIATTVAQGTAEGTFGPCAPRLVAAAAVAMCDGLGARVVLRDPQVRLAAARRTVATAVGVLVGHDGPLPLPGVRRR